MGLLDRLASSQPRYQPVQTPRPGVDPPYAAAPMPDRQTTKIILDAVATVRAANPKLPIQTAEHALEIVGFTETSQALIESGELDQQMYVVVKEVLVDKFAEGAHLAIAEEMSRAGKPNQIERHYAGVHARLRASASSGAPVHPVIGTPQYEFGILMRYMFDIGYFAIRNANA